MMQGAAITIYNLNSIIMNISDQWPIYLINLTYILSLDYTLNFLPQLISRTAHSSGEIRVSRLIVRHSAIVPAAAVLRKNRSLQFTPNFFDALPIDLLRPPRYRTTLVDYLAVVHVIVLGSWKW